MRLLCPEHLGPISRQFVDFLVDSVAQLRHRLLLHPVQRRRGGAIILRLPRPQVECGQRFERTQPDCGRTGQRRVLGAEILGGTFQGGAEEGIEGGRSGSQGLLRFVDLFGFLLVYFARTEEDEK